MQWTVCLDGGPQRVNHAAIGIPERKLVFSFGGYWTGKEYNDIEKIDTHVFNAVLLKWFKMKLPNENDPEYGMVPYMRYGHTVCAVGNIAYLFGGRNDNYGASNVLHCFDTDKLKWYIPEVEGAPPAARDGHSCCVVGSNVYIFGGYEEAADCFSCEIHFLDTEKMKWHHPGPCGKRPTWRDFHTSTTVGNKIYVFGGRGDNLGPFHSNSEIYDNRMYEYDTVKNVWTRVLVTGKIPVGRRSHSAIAVDSDIYIFGGYNGKMMSHFKDLWKFDTGSGRNPKFSEMDLAPEEGRAGVFLEPRQFFMEERVEDDSSSLPTDDDSKLQDLSDVYILDFAPSLKTLCKMAVIRHKLDADDLPTHLRQELERMSAVSLSNRSLPGLTQG